MGQAQTRETMFDGIRGWAAVMVLVGHLCSLLEKGFSRPCCPFPFHDALLAVEVFFVLSGVVLSLGYFKTGSFKPVTALAVKRIPRLAIPIFFSVLFVIVLMKCGLMFNAEATAVLGGNKYYGTPYSFDARWSDLIRFPFFDVFFRYRAFNAALGGGYNTVLWTMPIEFLGSYLVVFVLFIATFVRKRWLFVLLGIPVVAIAYFMGGTHLLAFLVGIFFAYIFTRHDSLIARIRGSVPSQILLFLVLAGVGVVYLAFKEHARWGWPIRSLVASLGVAAIVLNPWLKWFTETRLSVFLGKISFPLYLTHFPILCSFSSFLICRSWYSASFCPSLVVWLLSLAVSLLVAVLFLPVETLSVRLSAKIWHIITRFRQTPKPEDCHDK